MIDHDRLRRQLRVRCFTLLRTEWETNTFGERHFVLDVRYSGRERPGDQCFLMGAAVTAARTDGSLCPVACVAHLTDGHTHESRTLRFTASRGMPEEGSEGSDASFASVFQAFVHDANPIR
jgi:hypothetical protein